MSEPGDRAHDPLPEATLPRLEVLERHLRAMEMLAKRRVFIQEDLSAALAATLEVCALALDVQRASVWVLQADEAALHCLHLHDQTVATQGAGGTLPAGPYPTYFEALLSGKVIPADDAQGDPRTREFTEPYLKPLDIRSMLDAPIQVNHQLMGVVCLEHTRTLRTWNAEDLSFARFIAHTVSMAFEAHLRRGGVLPGRSVP